VKKFLFIDRDGTLINEYPPTYQIDSLEKVTFYPFAISYMRKIAEELDYELVMVSNQDGMGTDAFPESDLAPAHKLVITTFQNEGVYFKEELMTAAILSTTYPLANPVHGMFTAYLQNPEVDMADSFVIGDRITDVQLAKKLGCKAIWINNNPDLGGLRWRIALEELRQSVALETTDWKAIYEFLKKENGS
jgi:imidazoleglycerol-phosphate dehydratase/histidinol-phosphatase